MAPSQETHLPKPKHPYQVQIDFYSIMLLRSRDPARYLPQNVITSSTWVIYRKVVLVLILILPRERTAV